MTTLFAISAFCFSLGVCAVATFCFGQVDPKFGAMGSLGLGALLSLPVIPSAALGFYIAKRGFRHDPRRVVVLALLVGVSYRLATYPLVASAACAFIAARWSETDEATNAWRRSVT
jgi:hypothetical protein